MLIFKFVLGYSWMYSVTIAFVSSMMVLGILGSDLLNLKIKYLIINLVTFPFWYPLAIFGKNQITESVAGMIMIPAMYTTSIFDFLLMKTGLSTLISPIDMN